MAVPRRPRQLTLPARPASPPASDTPARIPATRRPGRSAASLVWTGEADQSDSVLNEQSRCGPPSGSVCRARRVTVVEGGEAGDPGEVRRFPGLPDWFPGFGERRLGVDVTAGDLHEAVRELATSRCSSPPWANDTMSSGWFMAPSSATVRPMVFDPGVRSARVIWTTGVHV